MNSIESILGMIATEAHESAWVCSYCKAIPPAPCEPWCETYIDNRIIALSEKAEQEGAESEVELCQRALDGHKQSREECLRVLTDLKKNEFSENKNNT